MQYLTGLKRGLRQVFHPSQQGVPIWAVPRTHSFVYTALQYLSPGQLINGEVTLNRVQSAGEELNL